MTAFRGVELGVVDDADVVVLADDAGRPLGTAPRATVHSSDTPLHLAFSAYLLSPDGRLLLTRRSLAKRAWPGVWTNACCGHLRPGEDAVAAALRRVPEELGAVPSDLRVVVPDFRYRAVDANGIVEHEICPVLVGVIDPNQLDPAAEEVAEWSWSSWEETAAAVRAAPFAFSPWCVEQIRLLEAAGGPAASPTAAARPHADAPSASAEGECLDAFLDRVERRLDGEMDRLDADWRRLAHDVPLDVLGEDLPRWMRRRLRGGKRFRSRMAYLGFTAVSDPAGREDDLAVLADLAAALECLHLFGLVHDDVMDESDSRRGGPSAHVEAAAWHERASGAGESGRFGESLAILLGDLAHTIADGIAAELPDAMRRSWRELCVELILGQRADLTGAAARRRDLDAASVVARLKSSRYTIERPLELGARIAGAGGVQRRVLAEWGEHAGVAFALRDDLLGVWGDPAVTGKPVGDDLLEAKPTAIMAMGAERLGGEDAAALNRLGSPGARPDDVARVAHALERAGIRVEVERRIAEAVEHADAAIAGAPLRPRGSEALASAVRSIAWRNV